MTYYTDCYYGGLFTREEMIEDAKENYDYGDPTNAFNSYILEENYTPITKEEYDRCEEIYTSKGPTPHSWNKILRHEGIIE